MHVIVGLLWVIFVLSALFLVLIILIQEGKGGGLAEAFGGQGAETFGVKAHGVNRVTAILAGVFLLSSILINKCAHQGAAILDEAAPAESAEDGGAGVNPAADAETGSGGEGN